MTTEALAVLEQQFPPPRGEVDRRSRCCASRRLAVLSEVTRWVSPTGWARTLATDKYPIMPTKSRSFIEAFPWRSWRCYPHLRQLTTTCSRRPSIYRRTWANVCIRVTARRPGTTGMVKVFGCRPSLVARRGMGPAYGNLHHFCHSAVCRSVSEADTWQGVHNIPYALMCRLPHGCDRGQPAASHSECAPPTNLAVCDGICKTE